MARAPGPIRPEWERGLKHFLAGPASDGSAGAVVVG
jgi:hypothetical protein